MSVSVVARRSAAHPCRRCRDERWMRACHWPTLAAFRAASIGHSISVIGKASRSSVWSPDAPGWTICDPPVASLSVLVPFRRSSVIPSLVALSGRPAAGSSFTDVPRPRTGRRGADRSIDRCHAVWRTHARAVSAHGPRGAGAQRDVEANPWLIGGAYAAARGSEGHRRAGGRTGEQPGGPLPDPYASPTWREDTEARHRMDRWRPNASEDNMGARVTASVSSATAEPALFRCGYVNRPAGPSLRKRPARRNDLPSAAPALPIPVMDAVANELPRNYPNLRSGVAKQTPLPPRWEPRAGQGHRGWDRARVRFIARGGTGRAEQLARRSFVRVGLSQPFVRAGLREAISRGPDATLTFLQRAASNPQAGGRAAAHAGRPDGGRRRPGPEGDRGGHVGPSGVGRHDASQAVRRAGPCRSRPGSRSCAARPILPRRSRAIAATRSWARPSRR